MSLQNAITFISEVDTDNELRKSCYTCKTQEGLLEHLKGKGRSFTSDEFDDAINMLLFKCQTYEQAGRVKEVKAWFNCFRR